jgi:hypothetical protein
MSPENQYDVNFIKKKKQKQKQTVSYTIRF